MQRVFSESNGMDAKCYLWCIAQAAITCGVNAFTVSNYDLYLGPSKAARMPRRKGATGRILSCTQAKLCQQFLPMAARTRTIQLSQLRQLNLAQFSVANETRDLYDPPATSGSRCQSCSFVCLCCYVLFQIYMYLSSTCTVVCINTIVKSQQGAVFRNFFKGGKPELRRDKFPRGAGVSESLQLHSNHTYIRSLVTLVTLGYLL